MRIELYCWWLSLWKVQANSHMEIHVETSNWVFTKETWRKLWISDRISMVCGNTIMYVRIQAWKPCISDRISMVCGNSIMLVRIQAWKPSILDRISMVCGNIMFVLIHAWKPCISATVSRAYWNSAFYVTFTVTETLRFISVTMPYWDYISEFSNSVPSLGSGGSRYEEESDTGKKP